jgi:predicted ferric reductase
VTLHIRALGDWTKRLYELDSKEGFDKDVELGTIGNEGSEVEGVRTHHMEERKENNWQDTMITISRSISITVEGPYGLPSVDLGGYYKVYLFIAGGIGDNGLFVNLLCYQTLFFELFYSIYFGISD